MFNLKKAVRETRQLVLEHDHDPSVSAYRADYPHSVFAALAQGYGYADGTPGDATRGLAHFARHAHISVFHLTVLLHACGTSKTPAGPDPWPLEPAQVWQALDEQTSLPDLDGITFPSFFVPFVDAFNIHMTNCDLGDARIERTWLSDARLLRLTLTGAVLHRVLAPRARIHRLTGRLCELSQCHFTHAPGHPGQSFHRLHSRSRFHRHPAPSCARRQRHHQR